MTELQRIPGILVDVADLEQLQTYAQEEDRSMSGTMRYILEQTDFNDLCFSDRPRGTLIYRTPLMMVRPEIREIVMQTAQSREKSQGAVIRAAIDQFFEKEKEATIKR